MNSMKTDLYRFRAEYTEEAGILLLDSPDPLTKERGICLETDCNAKKMLSILKQCENRVKSKEYTAETCSQEIIDLIQALDHCVGHKAFDKFV